MCDRSRPGRDERGTAMILLPAAVLILIMLSALTVDYSIAFLGRRELLNTAQSAANDAASAVALDRYHRDGTVVLDEDEAWNRVVDSMERRGAPAWLDIDDPEVTITGTTVEVVLHGRVHTVFSGAVPGGARDIAIQARASAVPIRR